MRFFVLRCALFWKNTADQCQGFLHKLRWLVYRAQCLLFRFMHYRTLFAFSHLTRSLGLTGRDIKLRAVVAQSNRQCLLNDNKRFDYIWLTQRRELLVQAATYGQNRALLQELSACSARLNAVVEPLQRAGHPVILAPLHMVSDVLSTMVGATVFPGRATVITSRSADAHSAAERQLGGLDLTYCSIHDNNKNIANNLMSSMMEAAENKRNIILFPDITPDFTHFASRDKAEKLRCRLFGRQAYLHSGIIRLARMMSAKVVFYHLYDDKGLQIYVHEPVQARTLKEDMPLIIEECIRKHSTDWMLWHSHSLFFINDGN